MQKSGNKLERQKTPGNNFIRPGGRWTMDRYAEQTSERQATTTPVWTKEHYAGADLRAPGNDHARVDVGTLRRSRRLIARRRPRPGGRWNVTQEQTPSAQNEPFKAHATPRSIPGSNSNSGDSPSSNQPRTLSRNQIKACYGRRPGEPGRQ